MLVIMLAHNLLPVHNASIHELVDALIQSWIFISKLILQIVQNLWGNVLYCSPNDSLNITIKFNPRDNFKSVISITIASFYISYVNQSIFSRENAGSVEFRN